MNGYYIFPKLNALTNIVPETDLIIIQDGTVSFFEHGDWVSYPVDGNVVYNVEVHYEKLADL